MRFQGFGWGITDTANIRLALTMVDAPDEAWRYMFRQSSPVGDEDLVRAYLSHGTVDNEIYVEVEPVTAEKVVPKALDWLSTTAAAVAEKHRTIVQISGRVGDSMLIWFTSRER